MTTVLHPVGPERPRVYWVRRLLVVLVVVALGVAVSVALRAVGSTLGGSGVAAGQTPAVTETTGAAGLPVACTPAGVTLAVTSDARTYPTPNKPVLSLGVTNTGTAACTIDAGEAAREVLVTSGTDRIWSSADCRGDAAKSLLLLAPGARQDIAVTWPRVRSAAGCAAALPAPRLGTYQVTVTMLGATTTPVAFQLS